jgi:hypothetical protein
MASGDLPEIAGDNVPVIRLNGSGWRDVFQFYDALLEALGSPPWHARSPDGLVDSIVWGGINERKPPYRIVVMAVSNAEVRAHIALCGECIDRSRYEYAMVNDEDPRVSLELGH